MKRLVLLGITLCLLLFAVTSHARKEVADAETMKQEAIKGFEQVLDLWRSGDFAALYDRTTTSGKDTRESFSKKMAAARLKPSCCWEKMQEVTAAVKSPTAVVVKAKIGLDAPGEMEFKTKSFKMVNEFGEWRIARSEILSLAEIGKVQKSRKHKAKVVQ